MTAPIAEALPVDVAANKAWYERISTEPTVHGRIVALTEIIREERAAAYRRGIEAAIRVIEAQEGMHGWKARVLSHLRALAPPQEGS